MVKENIPNRSVTGRQTSVSVILTDEAMTYFRRNRFPVQGALVLCVALSAATADYGDHNQAEPEKLASSAHNHLESANRASEEENWSRAVFYYLSAKELYRDLRERFPEWEVDFVEFRLEHCEDQLQYISEKTGHDDWHWWARDKYEWESERVRFEARIRALMEENLYRRERAREAELALEDLSAEIEELESLREDIRTLKEENRDLRNLLEERPGIEAPVPR